MHQAVLPSVLDVASLEGAEWWLQDTDCEDSPKEYHVDADVQVGLTVFLALDPTCRKVNQWDCTHKSIAGVAATEPRFPSLVTPIGVSSLRNYCH
jgi:hypothetical protein